MGTENDNLNQYYPIKKEVEQFIRFALQVYQTFLFGKHLIPY